MFDFGYSELFLIAAVILIFIGPKELPLILRSIFDFISKIKVYSSELRTGIQSIANDIEINEKGLKHPLYKLKDKKFNSPAFNFDEVVTLPNEATHLASNKILSLIHI